MTNGKAYSRRIYLGTHDGVCALNTVDGGHTWEKGELTPLANASARLSVSPVEPDRAYLAAYGSRDLQNRGRRQHMEPFAVIPYRLCTQRASSS